MSATQPNASPGSPFQRRAKDPFTTFCSVHPHRFRTRNDEEFYAGFRRSTSRNNENNNRIIYPGRAERRNSNNNSEKPGYLQDTLTSVRRSRERVAASPSFSRTPSLRRSKKPDQPNPSRPTSVYYKSSNNLSDYYRIYKPVNINPIKPGFTRTGSFHAGNKPVQLSLRSGGPNANGNPGSGPDTFMRSFSFRNRENENHSSMPCLNATKLTQPVLSSQMSHGGNFGTPSSSTLVINSLAYQVLSPNKTENDLNSQGFSSPSSSTTSSPQVKTFSETLEL